MYQSGWKCYQNDFIIQPTMAWKWHLLIFCIKIHPNFVWQLLLWTKSVNNSDKHIYNWIIFFALFEIITFPFPFCVVTWVGVKVKIFKFGCHFHSKQLHLNLFSLKQFNSITISHRKWMSVSKGNTQTQFKWIQFCCKSKME